jgi:hypothetical protein
MFLIGLFQQRFHFVGMMVLLKKISRRIAGVAG